MAQMDKAGAAYWDQNWTTADIPSLFSDSNQSLDNTVNLALHQYFSALFGTRKHFSICELGCANSIWPSYFHQYFGAHADGIDYSEVGVAKSQQLFEHYGVPGNIYCADLFAPPNELCNKYDYVVSFGVVEHFVQTAHCLQACARLLKPGGTLITLIPNMPGIVGTIQKWTDRAVYDVHVPLTCDSLAQAHRDANLMLQRCHYFMSMNLSVVNSGSFTQHPLNPSLRRLLSGLSKCVWKLSQLGLTLPTNRWTSPYIMALASKPPTSP